MNTVMSLQGLFAQHVELELPSKEAPNVRTEGSVPKKKTELHVLYTEGLFLTSTPPFCCFSGKSSTVRIAKSPNNRRD